MPTMEQSQSIGRAEHDFFEWLQAKLPSLPVTWNMSRQLDISTENK